MMQRGPVPRDRQVPALVHFRNNDFVGHGSAHIIRMLYSGGNVDLRMIHVLLGKLAQQVAYAIEASTLLVHGRYNPPWGFR